MPYSLSSQTDELLTVTTSGTVTAQERVEILDALRRLDNREAISTLIIDHRKANLECSLEDAVGFAGKLGEFLCFSGDTRCVVLPSESNRAVVDIAATKLAVSQGDQQIEICNSIEEALKVETPRKSNQQQHRQYLERYLQIEKELADLNTNEDIDDFETKSSLGIDQQAEIVHASSRAGANLIQDTLYKLELWRAWNSAELERNPSLADMLVLSTLKDLRTFFGGHDLPDRSHRGH